MKNRLLRLGTYVAVGVATGLLVAAVALISEEVLLRRVLELDLWQQALAPAVGLFAAVLILRWANIGRVLSSSTAEEYIRAYHNRNHPMLLRYLPFRLAAGITTIGLGGAAGLEGPSIYAGATTGSFTQKHLKKLFRGQDGYGLLVAGAAAGVSAIFQAPATGVLFALEAPYKSDLGRRALLPALLSSASSYVTYVLVTDFNTLPFNADTARVSVGFGRRELLGAAVVGALCGLGATIFSRIVARAKRISLSNRPWWLTALIGAAILSGLTVASHYLFDAPLTLGPTAEGQLTQWVLDPRASLWLLGALLIARVVATSTVLAGGGVGGVFIPLAVFGLIVGRLVGGWIDLGADSLAFFPFIGVAAFLAAGYRTPLAAVMFVAESTGAPDFVVPGLIAVAVTQVVVGSSSVSLYQRQARTGYLERRMQMPVTQALIRDVTLVSPDDTLTDFVWKTAIPKSLVAAVVADQENKRFLGVIRLADVQQIAQSEWGNITVGDAMVTDLTPARPSWTLREATEALTDAEVELYPVVDSGNRVVGVITENEIVKLVDLLSTSS